MLIDDDKMFLNVYKDLMEDHGFEVCVESSPLSAFERLRLGERFDLVITDILMAEMDGWSLIKSIRNKLNIDYVKLPIIVLSRVDSLKLEMDSLRELANAWIVKSNESFPQLLQQVNLLCGRYKREVSGDAD